MKKFDERKDNVKDYLDYYKAFRLVKVSDPYLPYIKGENNGWWIRKIPGKCKLDFLTEAETMEEIMEQFPVCEMYYELGYRNVIPFMYEDNLRFVDLHLRSGENSVCYHVDGTAAIKGELAFQYIYESFDNEIILITSSWNSEKLTDMSLNFNRGKEYWIHYDLEFMDK